MLERQCMVLERQCMMLEIVYDVRDSV